MRWSQGLGAERRKKDLKNRLAALEREAAEAAEKGDGLAQAIALNNLGATHADLEDWPAAWDTYLQAAAAVPAEASLDERSTPWGNAALAARRLKQWDKATLAGVWVDALAGEADDANLRLVADTALALARKAVGKEAFGALLDEAIAELPEDRRGFVRRDQHADPTFRSAD